ncbi:MAG: hypothetical protein SVT56_07300 [Chloroflexota bacterium]|nr:hypothetical protein [Chloroflexota bacterium]
MQRPEGYESIKAGAVTVRTFTVSVYHTREVVKGGTTYLCALFGRQTHKPGDPDIGNFPNAQQAVIDTAGIILTHPNATAWEQTLNRTIRTGAINAQYRDETGVRTLQGYQDAGQTIPLPWLTPIYDPISTGFGQTGMGQQGTRRWAWGENDNGLRFPQWDYQRILAHYYTGVEFDGAIIPNPPEGLRANILQIEGIGSLPGPIQPL